MEPMGTGVPFSSSETVVTCSVMTFGVVIRRRWMRVSSPLGSGNDTCSSMAPLKVRSSQRGTEKLHRGADGVVPSCWDTGRGW
jgi:hypothetical protein